MQPMPSPATLACIITVAFVARLLQSPSRKICGPRRALIEDGLLLVLTPKLRLGSGVGCSTRPQFLPVASRSILIIRRSSSRSCPSCSNASATSPLSSRVMTSSKQARVGYQMKKKLLGLRSDLRFRPRIFVHNQSRSIVWLNFSGPPVVAMTLDCAFLARRLQATHVSHSG